MRNVLKYIRITLIGFLLVVVCYATCYFFMPYWSNGFKSNQDHEGIEIYLVRSGVHTDVVMPLYHSTQDWTKVFTQSSPLDSTLDHIAVGWGHKAFYMETPTWSDLTVKNAVSATFGFGASAAHVRTIAKPSNDPSCRTMIVNERQYQSLTSYIKATVCAQDSAAIAIPLLAQPHDLYYEAQGSYHALRTCNTWIADALIAAEQSGPIWTASTEGLFND
jgi:uncharacterized protein (TIGR02117 family)